MKAKSFQKCKFKIKEKVEPNIKIGLLKIEQAKNRLREVGILETDWSKTQASL